MAAGLLGAAWLGMAQLQKNVLKQSAQMAQQSVQMQREADRLLSGEMPTGEYEQQGELVRLRFVDAALSEVLLWAP